MKSQRFGYLLTLLLLVSSAAAATHPVVNPADFNETVHVSSSEFQFPTGSGTDAVQILHVTIAGKSYTLAGTAIMADVKGVGLIHLGLIPTGDYKARLVQHRLYKPDYLIFDMYELLTPDGRTHQFSVSGVKE